jgi:hypothetical protein
MHDRMKEHNGAARLLLLLLLLPSSHAQAMTASMSIGQCSHAITFFAPAAVTTAAAAD